MNFKEIDDYAKELEAKFANCDNNILMAQEVFAHPGFSHVTIKNSWEANYVYFHCDNSPTGVSLCIVFDKPMLPYLSNPLDRALNNQY